MTKNKQGLEMQAFLILRAEKDPLLWFISQR